MEKEANQLYRRPQMNGQARDEEEEEDPVWPPSCSLPCYFRTNTLLLLTSLNNNF